MRIWEFENLGVRVSNSQSLKFSNSLLGFGRSFRGRRSIRCNVSFNGRLRRRRHSRYRDRLVAAPTRFANQRLRGLTHRGATAEPFIDLREIDLQAGWFALRIVVANGIEVGATTRILRLDDDHAVARLLLTADTTETNLNCHFHLPV